MAINRKKEAAGVGLPSRLADMLLRGFTFQALRDKYDGAFKDAKGEVVGYLEKNDDSFNVDLGKGFKCDQGTVIYTSRSSWEYDKDKIIELIKSKAITIETIVNMASFRAEDLKTALGEPAFLGLAKERTSESLTFRGTPEFKSSVDERFDSMTSPSPVDLSPLKASVEKPKVKSVADTVSKVKAIAAKSKKASASADDDLDAILKKS